MRHGSLHLNVMYKYVKCYDWEINIKRDISLNSSCLEVKLCIHADNIPFEGTVSQIFNICLSFYFMSKNG